MAFTNFVLTVAGVSAVILLMRTDVKQSASIFKRNVRQIRHWLEEESASATKYEKPPTHSSPNQSHLHNLKWVDAWNASCEYVVE
ncbi:hypothetical protein RJ639_020584 [Escallonia herrerae]|uniref:Uncharacterized protein n=1 Tax=Escallonia herrerae TaxID=1293975 RepID=A0AA89AE52_9ASTE|nr:hypothetical protein RJ639_024529 [Escallonia herrerae]KAK3001503.1 hypothetical protein RJ639_020584 [Escallonia herrerae]